MSLSTFFPSVTEGWDRLLAGPLCDFMDPFAGWLADQGYAHSTARRKLRAAGLLSRWLQDRSLGLAAIDEALLEQFGNELSSTCKDPARIQVDVRQLLEWLQTIAQAISITVDSPATDPEVQTLQHYECFLRQQCGASHHTVQAYLSTLRQFFHSDLEFRPGELDTISLQDINRFIIQASHTRGSATIHVFVAALRSFMRYLYQTGVQKTDLSVSIRGVKRFQLTHLPKGLEPQQVEAVLNSCDRTTTTGRRDYAVLCLLAHIGLRACEIVRLTLDDIDWHSAQITVVGKGNQRAVLPLPHQAGEAVAAYLLDGRSNCTTRTLFVTRKAPVQGFQTSSPVVDIVRRALARAGITLPYRGAAHLLRHALATRMLHNGASLVEIGHILRHQSPDSTRLYAKVDLETLRPLARAWPGGAA